MRPAKSGSGERISKTVKQRMAEYYHDMLWQNVGELVQQSVLWYDLPGYVHLPFALQHPRICLGLSNVLNDNMYSQFGGKLLRIYHMKKIREITWKCFLDVDDHEYKFGSHYFISVKTSHFSYFKSRFYII